MNVTQVSLERLLILDSWQLSASQLRGQTYDGAGAMAGKRRGAAAPISNLYPKAVYTHYVAHSFIMCGKLLQHYLNAIHDGYS